MKSIFLPATAVLMLAACGDAEQTPAATETADATASADMAEAPMAATPADANTTAAGYASTAALSDMYEVESSRLALEKSNSPEVKQFAQMMVDGHTKTTADLQTALSAAGVTVPPPAALDPRRAGMIEELRAKPAAEFDTAYVDQQTAAHTEALDLHQGYAANGDTPQIKAFAAKVAPIVQGHLDMVKKLDKTGADEPAANPPAQ